MTVKRNLFLCVIGTGLVFQECYKYQKPLKY